MPKYRCHKEVWALQIRSVELLTAPASEDAQLAEITFEGGMFGPRTVSLAKRPTPEPGWYYVIYQNGYASFSPPKEFEEGYARITP
jgi:hypothetical protein